METELSESEEIISGGEGRLEVMAVGTTAWAEVIINFIYNCRSGSIIDQNNA